MNLLKEILTRDCGKRLDWIAEGLGMSSSNFSNKLHGYEQNGYQAHFTPEEFQRMAVLVNVPIRLLERAWDESINQKNGNGASASS